MNINGNSGLRDGLIAGGAPIMWERAVLELLPGIRRHVPEGSRVLEVGYGDGLLTCYLCTELGWKVTGFDIVPKVQEVARENACRLGVEGRAVFHCCRPEETWQHKGQYDAVFIKTVFLYAPDLTEYSAWLDWVLSVLKPGGVFVNFETGRANGLVQAYRRLRGREYTDLCLYTQAVERLYDERFEIVERRYYGGWSQFLAPIPMIYRTAARVEEAIGMRHADNCFIVGMIAKKPG